MCLLRQEWCYEDRVSQVHRQGRKVRPASLDDLQWSVPIGIARVMREPCYQGGWAMQEFRSDYIAYIEATGKVVWGALV